MSGCQCGCHFPKPTQNVRIEISFRTHLGLGWNWRVITSSADYCGPANSPDDAWRTALCKMAEIAK